MVWRVTTKTFRVDNFNTLATVHVHAFFNYHGQYEISRQACPSDGEANAPQSQRCDASANDAEDGALHTNTRV